ncbi:MAG: hypothetical protein RKE49_00090 [Oceanicaulis sp.]
MSKLKAYMAARDELEKHRLALRAAETAHAAARSTLQTMEDEADELKETLLTYERLNAEREAEIERLEDEAGKLKKDEDRAQSDFEKVLSDDKANPDTIRQAERALSKARAAAMEASVKLALWRAGDKIGDELKKRTEAQAARLDRRITSQRSSVSSQAGKMTSAEKAVARAAKGVETAASKLEEGEATPITVDPDVVRLIANPRKRADFLAFDRAPANLDKRIRKALAELETRLEADREAVREDLIRRHLGGHFARAVDALDPQIRRPVTRAIANTALPAIIRDLAAETVSTEQAARQTEVVADMIKNALFAEDGPVHAFAEIYARIAANELGYSPNTSALQVAVAAIEGSL